MAHYRNLAAWQRCHQLVIEVYRATERFPAHERYGLTSQARRAAFSAAANLVEGCARRGSAEFRRYVDIALGSLAELSYTLLVARDLGLLSEAEYAGLEQTRKRSGFLTWRLGRALSKKRGAAGK